MYKNYKNFVKDMLVENGFHPLSISKRGDEVTFTVLNDSDFNAILELLKTRYSYFEYNKKRNLFVVTVGCENAI